MKYLIPCVLFFPLLSSCTVVQEDIYPPEFWGPAPRVEVNRYYPQGHNHRHYNQRYHSNNRYYTAPKARVYHDHVETRGNAVAVSPPPLQARAEVQKNVHGHDTNNSHVHGHSSSNGTTHGHPNSNIHGHDTNQGTTVQVEPSYGAPPEEQKKIHGHS